MKFHTKKFTKILLPNLSPRDLLLMLFPNTEISPNSKGEILQKISNFQEQLWLLFFLRVLIVQVAVYFKTKQNTQNSYVNINITVFIVTIGHR